jgi:diguanylate cyclase (GGDEF)-like protein/PAS domain S-box-containing protein
MQTKIIRTGVEILAVAIAYYLVARLALLLAIPPGYATAIWPSAGIALAALLLFGYRVAPGILLGSFFANVGTAPDLVGTSALLVPLGIGTGAMLQGIAGAALIRRFVGFPSALEREADIIKFLVLGGPVSCTISACIGVASLILTDTLPSHGYVINWIIWWVGDTIGTLIVTPLALTWRGTPRDIWQRRRKIVALPLCLACVAIVCVFYGAKGEFLAEEHSLLSWAALAGGLGFTGLLGAFLLIVSAHMMQIERLAAARTVELEQRLEIEEELKKFKFFSENANDAHLLLNQETRILYANKLACEQLGYCESELLHLNIPDISPLFPKERVQQLFEECRLGRCASFEALHQRKDGSILPVEITSTVLEFQGEWLMFSTVRNITERKLAEQAVRDSEAQLRATFEQAAVGIVHLSRPDQRFLRANRAFCRMTGYSSDELRNLTAFAITHPEDRHIGVEQYALLMLGGHANFVMEKRLVCKQGKVIWARITVSAIRDAADRMFYMMNVVEDITETKRSGRIRQDTERRLELAVDIAQLGFWEWNSVTNTLYWSPLLKKQLGYGADELPSCYKEWESRLHPDERQWVLDYLARYVEQPAPEYELEYRLRHRDGSYHWFVTRAIPVTGVDGGGVTLIGIHLDVTERKIGEQRIREAALHDPLTGLPNRALVFEYTGHLLASARRNDRSAALLFIDLDRFKVINDLHGHEMGDRLLIEVAKRLLACVRREDLVGRLGGDEFVVVLSDLEGGYRAEIVARHILESIERPFQVDAHELSVSLSIGISQFPKHGDNIDTLVRAADVAMYQAKQAGRGTYQFYVPEFDRRADELLTIEVTLKRALNGEGLALHYQPVIDMKSGRVIGAEALLRLSDPDMIDTCPQRFIPVAESAGLIGRLGEWVATEACRQHEAWIRQGMPPIQIAINVSPLQFHQGLFVERLIKIVTESGIKPACLQIEVTESAVMENVEEAVETLQQIKALGMTVALDDFGTGYSSLSHLSTLPLDKLKVDQSFIRRIRHDRASRAITKAIIALGRTLKLEVVGEGIESEDALKYLRRQGCDQAQGFLFSHPLPADEFAAWYRSRSAWGAAQKIG